MNLRVLLTILSSLSAAVTGVLGLATVVDPFGTAARFGVEVSEGPVLRTILLTMAATILSLAAITALAARWVFLDRNEGRTLTILCGASLLLVAALGGVVGGSQPILFLDGIRGAVLLVLAAIWTPGGDAPG